MRRRYDHFYNSLPTAIVILFTFFVEANSILCYKAYNNLSFYRLVLN